MTQIVCRELFFLDSKKEKIVNEDDSEDLPF